MDQLYTYYLSADSRRGVIGQWEVFWLVWKIVKKNQKKVAFMAKLVRHLTSNEEIVSSNLAEGILYLMWEISFLLKIEYIPIFEKHVL